jgi:hypothetical protein
MGGFSLIALLCAPAGNSPAADNAKAANAVRNANCFLLLISLLPDCKKILRSDGWDGPVLINQATSVNCFTTTSKEKRTDIYGRDAGISGEATASRGPNKSQTAPLKIKTSEGLQGKPCLSIWTPESSGHCSNCRISLMVLRSMRMLAIEA